MADETQPFLCTFASYGCVQTCKTSGDLKNHTRNCPFSTKPCPLLCGMDIPVVALVQHMTSNCPHRGQICQFCNDEVYQNQIDFHQQNCPFKPETCEFCDIELVKKEMCLHMENCPKKPLPCAMKSFGCEFVGEYLVRSVHEANVAFHLPLLFQRLPQIINKNSENTSSDIQNEIVNMKLLYSAQEKKYEQLEKKISDQTEIIKNNINTLSNKFIKENQILEMLLKDMRNEQSNELKDLKSEFKHLYDDNSKEFKLISKELKNVSDKYLSENELIREFIKDINLNNLKELKTDLNKSINSIALNHNKMENLSQDIQKMLSTNLKETEILRSEIKDIGTSLRENKQIIKNISDLSANNSKEIKSLEMETGRLINDQTLEIQSVKKDAKEIFESNTKYFQTIMEKSNIVSNNQCEDIRSLKKEIKDSSTKDAQEIQSIKSEIINQSTSQCHQLQNDITNVLNNSIKFSKESQSFIKEVLVNVCNQEKEIKLLKNEMNGLLGGHSKEIQSMTTYLKNVSIKNSNEIQSLRDVFTQNLTSLSSNHLKEIQNVKSEIKDLSTTKEIQNIKKEIQQLFESQCEEIRNLTKNSQEIVSNMKLIKDKSPIDATPTQQSRTNPNQRFNFSYSVPCHDGGAGSEFSQEINQLSGLGIDLTVGRESLFNGTMGELNDTIGNILYGKNAPQGNMICSFLFSKTFLELFDKNINGVVTFNQYPSNFNFNYSISWKANSFLIDLSLAQRQNGDILKQFTYAIIILTDFTFQKILYMNSIFSVSCRYFFDKENFVKEFKSEGKQIYGYILLCKPQ